MNKRLFTLACGLLFSLGLQASPAADCYKTVLNSPDLLVNLKIMYGGKNYWYFEKRAIELCSGASEANAPIQCFKESLNDPDMLKGIKSRYASYPYKIEDEIIGLCKGTH